MGVIAKADTPTPWISNCLAVRTPDGLVRVRIGPSDMNKAIQRNHFLLPTIDEVLPTLKAAHIFSLGDATEAFLQVNLSEKSSYLTTFCTHVEYYGGCACHLGFHQVQNNFSDGYMNP